MTIWKIKARELANWPGPIHEANGTIQAIFEERADPPFNIHDTKVLATYIDAREVCAAPV